MLDREKLQAAAKEAGADVFGVANIERFDDLPMEKNPRAIFPEVKSVIVIGRRITRGTFRGVEEGTQFMDYLLYGYNWLDKNFVSVTTINLAEFIEDNGWEAVPLPNLPTETPTMGISVKEGLPAPNVMLDFDDAAVRAGVGEIGYPEVLVTPRFGPRQRIQVILTDAEIEPTPILENQIGPAPEKCKDLCPLGAFVGEKEVTICGKKMTVADIDYSKCAKCKNGALGNIHHPAGKPDRLASVCIRSYMDLLDKEECLENKFASAFRVRPNWEIKNETDLFQTR